MGRKITNITLKPYGEFVIELLQRQKKNNKNNLFAFMVFLEITFNIFRTI